MALVYDAGALIAADRHDRLVWADHFNELDVGRKPVTTAPVVAQVSRSARQARLRMLLAGCDILDFSHSQAHQVGALLARSGVADVVDAHLVLIAGPNQVLTSDPDDLNALADQVSPRPAIRSV